MHARWAQQTSFLITLTADRAEAIVNDLCGRHAWNEWQRDGNLCVPNMFTWLWEGIIIDGHHEAGIGEEMTLEFDIVVG